MIFDIVVFSAAGLCALVILAVAAVISLRRRPPLFIPPDPDPSTPRIQPRRGPFDHERS